MGTAADDRVVRYRARLERYRVVLAAGPLSANLD
jgi:hypothetical protein